MSAIARAQADTIRRRAILSLLYITPAHALPVRDIRRELERCHGQCVTLPRVRADLTWLADVGLLRFAGDLAVLDESGGDVVMGRLRMPGDDDGVL